MVTGVPRYPHQTKTPVSAISLQYVGNCVFDHQCGPEQTAALLSAIVEYTHVRISSDAGPGSKPERLEAGFGAHTDRVKERASCLGRPTGIPYFLAIRVVLSMDHDVIGRRVGSATSGLYARRLEARGQADDGQPDMIRRLSFVRLTVS